MIVKQSPACIDLLYQNYYLLNSLCENIDVSCDKPFELIAEICNDLDFSHIVNHELILEYNDLVKIDSIEHRVLVSSKNIVIIASNDNSYVIRRSKNSSVIKLKVEGSNYTYARVLKTLSNSKMIYVCFLIGDTLVIVNVDHSAGIRVLYNHVKLAFKEIDSNYDSLTVSFEGRFVAMFMKSKSFNCKNCFFDCLSVLSTNYDLIHPNLITRVKYNVNASELYPEVESANDAYIIKYKSIHKVYKVI